MLTFSRWKTWSILAVLVAGIIFASPNLFPRDQVQDWPGWLPRGQINLGLDLQGGAHILFEVEIDKVFQERIENLRGEVRSALGSNDGLPRVLYTGLGVFGDMVRVRITNDGDMEEALRRLKELSLPVTQNAFGGVAAEELAFSRTDDQRIEIRLTDEATEAMRVAALSQSIEVVRRRIDELGTREPNIQRQGQDRILVQVPGETDPQRIIDLVGATAKLNFHMVDTSVPLGEAMAGRVPPGAVLYPSDDEIEPAVLVDRSPALGGERLDNATAGFDPQTGEPVVNFKFDSAGARRFADITQDNVGRRFAIVLDERVISAPVIREPILQGSGQISGNFTAESANDLAILLRAGALPAPLQAIEQRTVGAGLGQDSIDAGQFAAIVGFLAVIGFIFLTYNLFGLFANVALILNMVLVAGGLSLLGATLTLPGIAGIVLTIGMAVDANVLIFERIREELAAGKSSINAIESGYSRALSAIVDANITTFISAAILFQLGSGPVKGFAVTLAIGIITSVFTAFTVTRFIITLWLRRKRPSTLPI